MDFDGDGRLGLLSGSNCCDSLGFHLFRRKANGSWAPLKRLEFADTGTGMTEDVRAHIFDPLYTTKARGRGTGLGLVVVRQVLAEHGSHIEVESEPGRGARFRLIFPAAEAEGVAAGAALPRA